MFIAGEFITGNNKIIKVSIYTNCNQEKYKNTPDIEIGGDELKFTANPVEYRTERNSEFDTLISTTATIHLLVKNPPTYLYTKDYLNTQVCIYVEGESLPVFAGYLSPMNFSQSFESEWDEIDINCIDYIATLKYRTFTKDSSWLSLSEILLFAFNNYMPYIDANNLKYLYRLDKDKGDFFSLINNIYLRGQSIMGKNRKDFPKLSEVLNEVLQFLNLKCYSVGNKIKLVASQYITEDNIESPQLLTIDKAGFDTPNISIDEIYNQIELKIDTADIDTDDLKIISTDRLKALFNTKQLYYIEYSLTFKDGKEAQKASDRKQGWQYFMNLLERGYIDLTKTPKKEIRGTQNVEAFFIRVKDDAQWTFKWNRTAEGTDPDEGENAELIPLDLKPYHQHRIPYYMGKNLTAAFLSFGSIVYKYDPNDNSFPANIKMEDNLVLSVNGNRELFDAKETYPKVKDLCKAIPFAKYQSESSFQVFSPDDDKDLYYIIFKGSITLNPVKEIHALEGDFTTIEDGKVRYYARQYFKIDKDYNVPCEDKVNNTFTGDGRHSGLHGTLPFYHDFGSGTYAFSKDGEHGYCTADNTYQFVFEDKINKFPILQCMLIIGDKCLIEDKDSQGMPFNFHWIRYKEPKDCKDEAEYYAQSFSIGIDPKTGDYLIGQEYQIANNINYTYNLDTEGMAIPIHKSDYLSGAVRFIILTPIYMYKRAKRIQGLTPTQPFPEGIEMSLGEDLPVLPYVKNIILKDFTLTFTNSKGEEIITKSEQKDVIYQSKADKGFINKYDKTEFKINSAFNHEQRQIAGLRRNPNLSTVIIRDKENTRHEPLNNVYSPNLNVTAKAEQLYVDYYYNLLHRPRLTVHTSLYNIPFNSVGSFIGDKIKLPAFNNRIFYIYDAAFNIINSELFITLKECPPKEKVITIEDISQSDYNRFIDEVNKRKVELQKNNYDGLFTEPLKDIKKPIEINRDDSKELKDNERIFTPIAIFSRAKANTIQKTIILPSANGADGAKGENGADGADGQDGHTLTATAVLTGVYYNYFLIDVTSYVKVYYDDKEVTDYDVLYRYKGAGVKDWTAKDTRKRDSWGETARRDGTPLIVEYEVEYKGLKTFTTARLNNKEDEPRPNLLWNTSFNGITRSEMADDKILKSKLNIEHYSHSNLPALLFKGKGYDGSNAVQIVDKKRLATFKWNGIKVKPNTTYTISTWVRFFNLDGKGKMACDSYLSKDGKEEFVSYSKHPYNYIRRELREWTLAFWTFNSYQYDTLSVNFIANPDTGGDGHAQLQISQPKLEEGAFPTKWRDLEITPDSLLNAGIDINKKEIIATADNFKVQNQKGERTAIVDREGNFTAKTLNTTDKGAGHINVHDNLIEFFKPNTKQPARTIGYDAVTKTWIDKCFDSEGNVLWELSEFGYIKHYTSERWEHKYNGYITTKNIKAFFQDTPSALNDIFDKQNENVKDPIFIYRAARDTNGEIIKSENYSKEEAIDMNGRLFTRGNVWHKIDHGDISGGGGALNPFGSIREARPKEQMFAINHVNTYGGYIPFTGVVFTEETGYGFYMRYNQPVGTPPFDYNKIREEYDLTDELYRVEFKDINNVQGALITVINNGREVETFKVYRNHRRKDIDTGGGGGNPSDPATPDLPDYPDDPDDNPHFKP